MFEEVGIRPELYTRPKITTVLRENEGIVYPVEKPRAVSEFLYLALKGLSPANIVALAPDWAEIEALRRTFPRARISGITGNANEELMTAARDANALLLQGELVRLGEDSSLPIEKTGVPDLVLVRNPLVTQNEGWRIALPFFAKKVATHGGTMLISTQTLEDAKVAESMLLQGGIRTAEGRLNKYRYLNGYISGLGNGTPILKADSYFLRLGQ